MTVRWRFTDASTSEFWDMEINPNEMGSPFRVWETETFGASPVDGRVRARRPSRRPVEWSFGGIIRSKQQYDTLQSWFDRSATLVIRDHFDREFRVKVYDFAPEPRRDTKTNGWRYTYQIRAHLYGETAGFLVGGPNPVGGDGDGDDKTGLMDSATRLLGRPVSSSVGLGDDVVAVSIYGVAVVDSAGVADDTARVVE